MYVEILHWNKMFEGLWHSSGSDSSASHHWGLVPIPGQSKCAYWWTMWQWYRSPSLSIILPIFHTHSFTLQLWYIVLAIDSIVKQHVQKLTKVKTGNFISEHVKNKPVTAIRPSRDISKHVTGAVWLCWHCCEVFRLLPTGLMLPLVGPIASSRRKLQNVMRLPPEIFAQHIL
jgi:hypothetical protein